MKTHHTLLPLIALAILALALPCCRADSDPTEPAAPVSTRFAISSRAQESVADNELIHDYTVTFVNNVSTVCAVVERDESAAGFEHDEFDVELNPGYYTVYAYANRSALPENIRTALGSLSEGAPLPEGFADLTADFPAYAGAGSLIPMSGVMNGVEISSRPGVNTSIELIRMLARVEFEFSNASADPIEVTGVTFGPVYSGDVTALPVFDNNSRDIARPVILDGSLASTVEHDVDVRLTGEQRTLASHFYIRESVADSHPTGQFTFAVRVQRNGREEEELYALAPDISAIRRNDYIQIPVVLTDYSLDVDTEFYPPIGGYPAVVVEQNNNEYYIRFGSSGKFTIIPKVRRSADGSTVAPAYLDVEVDKVTDTSGILEGDDGQKLKVQSGELLGTLASGPSRGTAVVNLGITVNEPDRPASRTFRRNFHIVRD